MTRARDVANLIGSGNYSSTTFTATAGQTAFTIAHTQGFVQVFMNGLLLDETADYTSNGTAITLTSGAAAGDEIEVVKYNTFSVGDAIPASGGTFTGNVSMSSGSTLDASAGTILPSAGQTVQEVTSTITTNTTFSSNSYLDASGFSVTITPKYSNSKMVISIWAKSLLNNTSLNAGQDYRILRDSTSIMTSRWTHYLNRNDYTADFYPIFILNMIDEPNTTSATTYKMQGRTYNGADASWGFDSNGGSTLYMMSVREIKQ